MSEIILRPYQIDALNQIRSHYAKGTKNVLLHMATGSGKTVIFSTIMRGIQDKGNRCVLAVRGRDLVGNASQRLLREGVDHGVMMAGHKGWSPDKAIQACSIDTLVSRKNLPPADLMVIDEAHFAVSKSFRWFIDHYRSQGIFTLGVTATPHVKSGLRHLADVVVYPITIQQLIDQGYLVRPRYFSPPSGIDYSQIKVDSKTGDYNMVDLGREVDKSHITGDIISHYKMLASGRPTILFACDINHSKKIVSELLSAGIPSLHVDADSNDEERKNAIQCLDSGKIKIVSNVGIFCTGVDIPCTSCIILARPTKSYNLFIQQIGRGTRPYNGKTDFIVLDHADNVEKHGFIEDEMLCNLDGATFSERKPTVTRCRVCYYAWNPSEQWKEKNPELAAIGKRGKDYICEGTVIKNGVEPETCLFDNTPIVNRKESKSISVVDGSLKEILNRNYFNDLKSEKFVEGLISKSISRGYKPGWIFYQLKKKYGNVTAIEIWKKVKQRVVKF